MTDVLEQSSSSLVLPPVLPPPHPPNCRRRDLFQDPSIFAELDEYVDQVSNQINANFSLNVLLDSLALLCSLLFFLKLVVMLCTKIAQKEHTTWTDLVNELTAHVLDDLGKARYTDISLIKATFSHIHIAFYHFGYYCVVCYCCVL